MMNVRVYHESTRVIHDGRDPSQQHGYVNPPAIRASTRLYPNLAAYESKLEQRHDQPSYGRINTPTSRALEHAVVGLEGGYRAAIASSGLGAVTLSILAFVRAGSHILVTDNVYGPTRRFCDVTLARLGVEVTYFDPGVGAGIAELLRPATSLVVVEAPGTFTFEMTDIPAIADIAHRHGARVVMDNTWATPIYFKAISHGVDVSVHAATKYISGHSDLLLGIAICTKDSFLPVREEAERLGQWAGPDDMVLTMRGLRTLPLRLERHWQSGMKIADWLCSRPEVARVLHPALPSDPGYALWKRDFLGASGLFGIVLKPVAEEALARFFNGLKLFGIGDSWGGFESLLIPTHPARSRKVCRWDEPGPTLRISVGLEDPTDLIADLQDGFRRLHDS